MPRKNVVGMVVKTAKTVNKKPRKKVVRKKPHAIIVVKGQRGNGFWGNIWNGIRKGANFVTGNGLISKGLDIAGMVGVPGANIAGKVAKQVGLGKKKIYKKLK